MLRRLSILVKNPIIVYRNQSAMWLCYANSEITSCIAYTTIFMTQSNLQKIALLHNYFIYSLKITGLIKQLYLPMKDIHSFA